MDINNDYETLYQHWLREYNQVGLTPLSQQDYESFKRLNDNLDNLEKPVNEPVKNQLMHAYCENLKYLFNDFLKMREIKILNAAISLQELDLNNAIEAEKTFYQKLVSSVKGFKKMKGISLYDSYKEEIEDVKKVEDLKKSPITTEQDKEEPIKTSEPEEDVKTLEMVIDPIYLEKKREYLIIRFLKKTPPLVGTDLINYGPFEIEDIAYIPINNAKILIDEKFAETFTVD